VSDLLGPRFKLPVVVLVALLVHAQLLSDVRVAGVHPDLMLLVAVAGGIAAGPSAGAVLGFSVGLLTDLLFLETPLGLSAMVFCLVGYGVGLLQAGVLRSSWWLPVITSLVACAAGEALFALVGALFGQRQLVTGRLPLVAGVVGLLDGLLAVVVVPVIRSALRSPGSRAYA
jgi:rod shape-determining protein MreD